MRTRLIIAFLLNFFQFKVDILCETSYARDYLSALQTHKQTHTHKYVHIKHICSSLSFNYRRRSRLSPPLWPNQIRACSYRRTQKFFFKLNIAKKRKFIKRKNRRKNRAFQRLIPLPPVGSVKAICLKIDLLWARMLFSWREKYSFFE